MKAKILLSCLLLGLFLVDAFTNSPTPGATDFASALDDVFARFVSGSF